MKHPLQIIPEDFKNPIKLDRLLKTKPESYWSSRGERRVLDLFHLMAKRVPAYKDFLKKNKINHLLVKNISDFKKVPPVDKNNYLRVYPLEALCWDGEFDSKRWTVAVNSGSTGEPFYFPREIGQDRQYGLCAELYLRNNFEIHKKSTLYIDTWAMGAWIGGLFTYEALRLLAERGKYKLSIIAPGIVKDEIFKAVKSLGHKFDQVIIGGYPPFVKDILDEGETLGINWKKNNIKLIFSAESFSEEFRDYVYERAGIRDTYKGSLNHYGTADMGTMAHETPLSVYIRRVARDNLKIHNRLFVERKVPTLTQYIPELFYFEEVNAVLYCSGYSGLPFVRYDLKDWGGVISLASLAKIFKEENIDLSRETRKVGINNTVWNLPFVYVYERVDFSVKLYGAVIFPDSVRHALQTKRFSAGVTGKFTMYVDFDDKQDQFLVVNVELKKGVAKTIEFERMLQTEIVERLKTENSEYFSNYRSQPERQTPRVVLWDYESPEFFRPGIKQKWVKK
ncbi:MAG: hypothetical protein ACD_52C00122G0008 [uncultured bacterium]|nr:MAG: hypothetical protein ACD_52C00122G0008 [uncultured bacterium]